MQPASGRLFASPIDFDLSFRAIVLMNTKSRKKEIYIEGKDEVEIEKLRLTRIAESPRHERTIARLE
jgi:hypothetical protein